MNERLPSLNALKAFEAAAKHMSFLQAADELHVTPAALSYQIKQLEESLEVKLFTRLNRAVELTEEGKLIQPFIRDGFMQFREAIKRLHQMRESNVLNITAGPAVTSKILIPNLYDFVSKFPDIDARISATLSVLDLHERDYDIAIRFGDGNYPGCTSIKLFDEYAMPLCSPKLLEGSNALKTPDDLKNHTLIHDDTHKLDPEIAATWADWLKAAEVENTNTESHLHFDSADHAIDAAVAGAGVLLGRTALAKKDMRMNHLVAPFDLKIKSKYCFYAVCLESRANEEKIKQFCDWLIKIK